MKPTAHVTHYLLLKAYSEIGRNNFEVAIVNLSGDWLKRSEQSLEIAQILSLEPALGCIGRTDNTDRFIYTGTDEMPFYEDLFGGSDHTFIETDQNEIDRLCKRLHQINSYALIVLPTGMARYQAPEDLTFKTVEFDLKLILEILKK